MRMASAIDLPRRAMKSVDSDKFKNCLSKGLTGSFTPC